MFGSNDDKKTPAEPGEKKGLFGWLRKKPQPASAEQPATEPQADSEPVEQTVANVETPAATPQHEEPRAVEADLQPTEVIESPLPDPVPEPEPEPEPVSAPVVAATSEAPAKLGFFARLRQGLSKTSASIGEGMASLFLG